MELNEIENLVKEVFDDIYTGEQEITVGDQDIVDFFRTNINPSDEQVHDFAQQMNMPKDEMEEKIYKLLSNLLNNKKQPSPEVDVSGKSKEKVEGGKGDSRPDSDFDPEQLRNGIKIESEHTNDPEIAKEIAKDHLTEDPEYYIKLAKIEPKNKEIKEELPIKRKSKITQKIDPMDIEKVKSGGDEFKKSNFVPLSQVKLMIAQTLNQFKNKMSPETMQQLQSVLATSLAEQKKINEVIEQNEVIPVLRPGDSVKWNFGKGDYAIGVVTDVKTDKDLYPKGKPKLSNKKENSKYDFIYVWFEWSKWIKDGQEQPQSQIDITLGSQSKGMYLWNDLNLIKKLKGIEKIEGENQEMESKNLKETIEGVIKEFCRSKNVNLEEVFDFEKEPGDVTEFFNKKKKEDIKKKDDEKKKDNDKQNAYWQSFMEEEVEPEQANQEVADELMMYIENDADLYRQSYLPMIKNLAIKKARGNYDPDKAIKLFMYLADRGAQKYVQENDPGNVKWHHTFPKSIRLAVAQMLRDKFQQEVSDKAYDYDAMLPKKYKGTELKQEEETLQEIWVKKSSRVGTILLERMGIKNEEVEKIEEEQLSDEQIEKIYNGTFALENPEHEEVGDTNQIAEVAPEGYENVVKGIKKSIKRGDTSKTYDGGKKTSPEAIAWSMKNKGIKPKK